ncbi:MAG: hypothetical protein WA323_21825 [Candidatus Nitrosopolaris sp.]
MTGQDKATALNAYTKAVVLSIIENTDAERMNILSKVSTNIKPVAKNTASIEPPVRISE